MRVTLLPVSKSAISWNLDSIPPMSSARARACGIRSVSPCSVGPVGGPEEAPGPVDGLVKVLGPVLGPGEMLGLVDGPTGVLGPMSGPAKDSGPVGGPEKVP